MNTAWWKILLLTSWFIGEDSAMVSYIPKESECSDSITIVLSTIVLTRKKEKREHRKKSAFTEKSCNEKTTFFREGNILAFFSYPVLCQSSLSK